MNPSTKARITQARKLICVMSILIMLSGLLFSRVLLSSGLVIFAATCLIRENVKEQLKTFFSSPFLWSMSLLFVLPLISGIWSDDVLNWSQILRIKLPLVLLPVCFAALNDFTNRDWEKISLGFLILVISGAGWSLWEYFHHIHLVHAAYLKAQTISTPLGNDHVRFSLLVSIAIITGAFVLITKRKSLSRGFVIALWVALLTFIIYLHVLAARTGLICFYLGSFIFIIWLIRHAKNKSRYAWFLVLILFLPVASWIVFPTFRNRIAYLRYDLSFIRNNVYRNASNDGNRLVSIQAGWQLQRQHPFAGVGFGDIKTETDKWYLANYPQMSDTDKILPSSEWMLYGAGTGWPGFVLFSIVMFIPFFVQALRKNIYWWLLNTFMALSYLFDIGLEVQFGVFIHSFVLLWWYKWLSAVPKVQKPERVQQD